MVVVAISGLHGAGKTTVAKAIAEKFGLDYICAGKIFREMAKEKGMALEEFSTHVETRPEIDKLIDKKTVEAIKKNNVLIDARLAGWIAKDADLKILLTAPLEVRVKRIAGRERSSYEKMLKETIVRERSEARRFKKLYKIDVNDVSIFDIVINTEHLSAEEVVNILESAVATIIKR